MPGRLTIKNHRAPWVWKHQRAPMYSAYPPRVDQLRLRLDRRTCTNAEGSTWTYHVVDRSRKEPHDRKAGHQDGIGSVGKCHILSSSGAQAGHSGKHADGAIDDEETSTAGAQRLTRSTRTRRCTLESSANCLSAISLILRALDDLHLIGPTRSLASLADSPP